MVSINISLLLIISYTALSSYSPGEEGECAAPQGHGSPSDLVLLNNGLRMPVIGLGTAGFTEPHLVHETLFTALQAGYRMIGKHEIQS